MNVIQSGAKRAIVAALMKFCLFGASAQLINFERLPDGSIPTDGTTISTQYQESFGVSFAFADSTFPHIAKIGSPPTAFWGINRGRGPDQPQPKQNVGTFFLTDDGVLIGTQPPPPLIITYAIPVLAASGSILDIDFADAWLIEARNCQGFVIAKTNLTTVSPNAGDGLATAWGISMQQAEICSIVITYIGEGENPGLAFDNFSPSLPASPPELSIELEGNKPHLTIRGSFEGQYQVEYIDDVFGASWSLMERIVLLDAPERTIVDEHATEQLKSRFYRALLIP